MNAHWVIFNGAPVYLDPKTITKIIEMKGPLKEFKADHIPNFVPRAVSFTLDDVLKCQPIKDEKKPDWTRLPRL